ncbi:Asparagine--tRNA ligase [Psilocybe cubensis]|uniref:asparagine--tRNA ligase n=2 Tax=Psilocybe cubensis TaxID=181762 RepID=A0A8H8CMU7_PSICU|nr:Asparagine--tRNA ligase [Psilocybe cubensis]KAH9483840.1 Asparagine--tRNA ligase [Psilocybe cubensis]
MFPPRLALPPTISHLLAHPPLPIHSTTVSGWIRSIRKQKNLAFAVITDGSAPQGLQVVFLKGLDLQKLTNGASVRVTGRLVQSPGSGQSHELLVDQADAGRVAVLGECNPDTYPIQKQELSIEHLRDNVHLRARTSHIAAMLRLRDRLQRQINSWFEEQGFCYANTPVITGNDAEGAGEAFRLAMVESQHPASASATPPAEFFSRPAFLTVSHQLHLEALATAISRVYTLSPCFRAEKSMTGRHLAEFWMLEAEWAFPADNGVHGVCDLTEALLKETTAPLLDSPDLRVLWKDGDAHKLKTLSDAVNSEKPWARMSYSEAIEELSKIHPSQNFVHTPVWGHALQSEHERWLAETLVGGPVFVTDYPASLKPFYMRLNSDERTVACFDLLVPHVGELIGGSVREERVELLSKKMEDVPGSEWYLDLRKYGGAPHAGFGMGFERLISWVSGVDNIRECIPMPRWAGRMLL